MVPFVIAGALMALAFGAHVFVGTRETRSLRPAAHPSSSSVPPSWCGVHLLCSNGAHPKSKKSIFWMKTIESDISTIVLTRSCF